MKIRINCRNIITWWSWLWMNSWVGLLSRFYSRIHGIGDLLWASRLAECLCRRERREKWTVQKEKEDGLTKKEVSFEARSWGTVDGLLTKIEQPDQFWGPFSFMPCGTSIFIVFHKKFLTYSFSDLWEYLVQKSIFGRKSFHRECHPDLLRSGFSVIIQQKP